MKSDDQLIEETRAGDSAAFGQLVRRYQTRLYSTLWHVVGNPEEAEDLVQDAFVQAYVKLDTFRGRSAFYTWLYRIAFNAAVSMKRKRRIEISVDRQRETTGDEPRDDGETPEEQLLREERADQVYTAMAQLSDEHRAILVLREMEGCCYETISEVLDLPVGTVRSRLHRARLQLREQLKEMLHENLAE